MAAFSTETARKIWAYVEIDGVSIPVVSASCAISKLAASNNFSAELPLHYGDADTAFWAALTSKSKCSLFVSDGKQTKRMVSAPLDSLDLKFASQRVSISARSSDRKALNAKSNEQWHNRKPTEVVKDIADRHGWNFVTDDVEDTSQDDQAGKMHHLDNVKITDSDTEWGVIQKLAEEEGVNAWLDGDTLYFKEADDDNDDVYVVNYKAPSPVHAAFADFIDLKITRHLGAGKAVRCHTHSWHSKSKKVVHGKHEIAGDDDKDALEYHERVANLSQHKADRRARKNARKHARHEITISLDMPGDLDCNPSKRLELRGTGGFDHIYYIDTVNYSIGDGLRMTIDAKNTKPGRKGGGGKTRAAPKSTKAPLPPKRPTGL
ncbi:hypothetical protein [Methylosinus sp. PW1]|uniref:hypothetical protein n=1 Tax=Methylosinus sp. PW1 TaxID=107636 RepID=UPI00055F4517|nr:hypothetical protein [Methylosinus sp. PW1]